MRYLKFALAAVAIAAVALLVSSENARAADDVEYNYPESLYAIQVGDTVTITATVTNASAAHDFIEFRSYTGAQTQWQTVEVVDGSASYSHSFVIDEADLTLCIGASGQILIGTTATGQPLTMPPEYFHTYIPCSVLSIPNLNAIQQNPICGADNDESSSPDQPEGVTLQSDSGWIENERIINFMILDGYVTDGATSFTFTDANEPCPETLKEKTVTVNLMTSDGGSLEGASYALFAPMASQSAPTAFEEGVVRSNNQLVFENIITGQYRLTITASGYEPLDKVFTVSEGSAPEQFEFQRVAIQEAPAPTAAPVREETTPTAVPVHGLPDTGTNTTDGTFPLVTFLMLTTSIIVLAISLRINGKIESRLK